MTRRVDADGVSYQICSIGYHIGRYPAAGAGVGVHILSKRRLREFWARHPDAQAPLTDWFRLVRARRYGSPHDVRRDFPAASFLGAGKTVFNVAGGRYRLVVVMRYETGRAYVLRVVTHQEYDRLGAEGRLWG